MKHFLYNFLVLFPFFVFSLLFSCSFSLKNKEKENNNTDYVVLAHEKCVHKQIKKKTVWQNKIKKKTQRKCKSNGKKSGSKAIEYFTKWKSPLISNIFPFPVCMRICVFIRILLMPPHLISFIFAEVKSQYFDVSIYTLSIRHIQMREILLRFAVVFENNFFFVNEKRNALRLNV